MGRRDDEQKNIFDERLRPFEHRIARDSNRSWGRLISEKETETEVGGTKTGSANEGATPIAKSRSDSCSLR